MNQEQAQVSQDRSRSMHNIFTGAFSLLLFIGIAVCAICDTAISRSFTWSLYPISAIVFTWLVFIPMIKFGKSLRLPAHVQYFYCTVFVCTS